MEKREGERGGQGTFELENRSFALSLTLFILDLWQIASEVETKTELVLARIPGALPKRTTASILEYARRYDIVTRYEEYPDIVSFLTALSIKAETGGLQAWE